jgi:class 3 adenylate cyclase
VAEGSRALLLIADISGYTRFMRLHRMSLAHAQENTSRLLKAIVDSSSKVKLVQYEGDAAFLAATGSSADRAAAEIVELAATMHRAFHREQDALRGCRVCLCDGCHQAGTLQVKFVAHLGEAVMHGGKRHSSLAGIDVILVHRMLKNDVEVEEYLLMTDQVHELAQRDAAPVEQELEGIGREQLWLVDVAAVAGEVPEAPPPPLRRKVRHEMGLTLRSLPYYVKLKRARVRVETAA